MHVKIFCLADQGQVADEKLYLLGAGWQVIGSQPGAIVPAYAVALMTEVPWSETDQDHEISLTLTDDQDEAIIRPDGQPMTVAYRQRVGRPPGVLLGGPMSVPMVLQIGPMPLLAGKYTWKLTLDGATNLDWELPFTVREPPRP